jgi:Integrase core domain
MSFNYEDRIKILKYSFKHGIPLAIEAVAFSGKSINRATIYRWRKSFSAVGKSQGFVSDYMALNPKSTRPKKFKSSELPSVFIEFIKLYRKKRFGVGKVKLAVIIKSACSDLSYAMEIKAEYGLLLYGLKPVSASTIGRILSGLKKSRSIHRNSKEYNKYKQVYLNGGTGELKYRKPIDRSKLYGVKKNRKPKDYKPSQVGDLVQMDAVTIQVPIMDNDTGVVTTKKLYFVCGIDLVSRLAYSRCYTNLSSSSTTDFIQRFGLKLTQLTRHSIQDQKEKQNHQIKIKKVQTDNGQENLKHFFKHLQKQGIIQYFNYPRSPKMNAFIEKYNHTVQAECIEYNIYLLRQGNLQQFNLNLEEWNNWYNHQRPHTSLQYLSPMQYFNQQLQTFNLSQM